MAEIVFVIVVVALLLFMTPTRGQGFEDRDWQSKKKDQNGPGGL